MPFSEYVMIGAVNHSLRPMSRSPPNQGRLRQSRLRRHAQQGVPEPPIRSSSSRSRFAKGNPRPREPQDAEELGGLAAAPRSDPKRRCSHPGSRSRHRPPPGLQQMNGPIASVPARVRLKSTEWRNRRPSARSAGEVYRHHHGKGGVLRIAGPPERQTSTARLFVAVESDVPTGITFFEAGEETIRAADWPGPTAGCTGSASSQANEWTRPSGDVVRLGSPNCVARRRLPR